MLTCFLFGNRNVSPKTCSHITSTVPVKWLDGWGESVKHWSLWRLCQLRDLFVYGRTKHCVSSRTGEDRGYSVMWVYANNCYTSESNIMHQGFVLKVVVWLWQLSFLVYFSRLVEDDERKWTDENVNNVALKHFPNIDRNAALVRPILFSNWLSKDYMPVEQEELRDFVKARLKVWMNQLGKLFCDKLIVGKLCQYFENR